MAIEMSTQASSSHRPDPRTLTSLPEILSSLSALESEEADVSTSLSELLANREPIIDSLTRIQSLVPRINELYSEATLLSGTVTATAKTADRVGGRVRSLDEEMRRVREAGERVGQVMELKVRLVIVRSHTISHVVYIAVFASCSSVCNGNTRLGVCNQALCKSDVLATRRDFRSIR